MILGSELDGLGVNVVVVIIGCVILDRGYCLGFCGLFFLL